MNRRLLAALALLALVAIPSLGSAGPYGRQYYSSCTPYYSTAYYTPYYAPTYYAAPTYTAPAAPAVPVYSKDWRTELISYNTALKEIEAYNQALATVVPGYSAHANYYSGQGATLYGAPAYSVKAAVVQENVGVNLELADQRSARLIDGTKEAMAQGMSQRQEFLAVASQENARVAEINAKANAVALAQQQTAELFRAANAAGSSKTTTVVAGTGNAPVAVAQPNVAQNGQWAEFMKRYARPDCARCHAPGPAMKGGFNIESLPSLNRVQSDRVWAKLTSDDSAQVMPKPEAGKPVQHLPPDHMMAWAAMLSQAQ